MTFSVIDFIFIFVIILFAILGVIRGFIDNVFGKLSWILGILGAFFLYGQVANNVLKGLNNRIVANILAFIILFVIIFLIIKMIQVIIGRLFELPILNSLDKALGFFFGVVEGIAVVALVIFILCNQPFFDIYNLFDGSFFFKLFDRFLANVDLSAFEVIKNNV